MEKKGNKISYSDLLNYIDISPEFEQDVLKRAKEQLLLSGVLEKVSMLMSSISTHFQSVQTELDQLSQLLGMVKMDLPYANLLSSFSQMFDAWGRQYVSQSNLSLQAIRKTILPEIEKFTSQYEESNHNYLLALERLASAPKNAKNEDNQSVEFSFIKSANVRSGLFYALANQVNISETATVDAISIAITQFVSLTANCMDEYLQQNRDLIQLTNSAVAELNTNVKRSLSSMCSPENNPATKASQQYWDMRFSKGAKNVEEFTRPNSTVWLREAHALRPTTWGRKTLSFMDCLLNARDALGAPDSKWVLPLVTVAPLEKSRRFCFKIQSPQELIEIQALSKLDLDEWVTVFTNHNFRMLGQDVGASTKVCADCGAHDATWCSVNWAVPLCLRCSGVHRQMSSSNSKVRSETLDHLHPFVTKMMEALDGEANRLLLASPPPDTIDARSDEPARASFIGRKYVAMDWAITGPVPDPFQALRDGDLRALFHAAHFGRIDDRDDSITPFHAACALGDANATALLSLCVKDLNVRDRKGWTPLCYAVFFQHVDIVAFLLQIGADPKNVGINLYQLAIATNNMKIAKLILVVANPVRNGEVCFQPCTLKYAPPGTPPDYKLALRQFSGSSSN